MHLYASESDFSLFVFLLLFMSKVFTSILFYFSFCCDYFFIFIVRVGTVQIVPAFVLFFIINFVSIDFITSDYLLDHSFKF